MSDEVIGGPCKKCGQQGFFNCCEEIQEAIDCPIGFSDNNEPLTREWIFSRFPSKGEQYSARESRDVPGLEYWNRFERFVYKGEPLTVATRGDIRTFVRLVGGDEAKLI